MDYNHFEFAERLGEKKKLYINLINKCHTVNKMFLGSIVCPAEIKLRIDF